MVGSFLSRAQKMENSSSRTSNMAAVYQAVSDQKSDSLDVLCNFCRENPGPKRIDRDGNTILHFLAIHNNVIAFNKLIEKGLMSNELLSASNSQGNTALHEAARFGHKEVAEVMVERERSLVSLENNAGENPIYVAAAYGNGNMFDFLTTEIPPTHETLSYLTTKDGCTVLHAAAKAEYYSLAVKILDSYPDLAVKRDKTGMTALNLLASKPLSFRSGSPYSVGNIGSTPYIPGQFLGILVYFCIPSMVYISKLGRTFWSKSLTRYRRLLRAWPWIRAVDNAKQKHVFAEELTKKLIEAKSEWFDNENFLASSEKDPLIQATEHGINEMVMEILQIFPDAATVLDKNGRNILHVAAQRKNVTLYSYLKRTLNHTHKMLADVDNSGNTILHFAANNHYYPQNIIGPLFSMIWDVFWFKLIEKDCHPALLSHRNHDHQKTAKELFDENHFDLKEKAATTAKDMNNGFLVVSTLIGAVNFAALFTIPGGFDQDNGVPIFLTKAKDHEQEIRRFVVYVGGSLVASLAALGAQVSIQLSQIDTNDFLVSFPVKYISAVTALNAAAGFSIDACFQTVILEQAFVNSYFSILGLTGLLLFLLYLDAMYPIINYMYYMICSSLTYKGQTM